FAGGTHIEGQGGNDLIYVGDSLTFIDEPNANNAQVMSAVNFSLYSGSFNNITHLTLTGSLNINGTGTGGNDVLVGNSGNNVLTGNGGDDTFTGGGGNDTINGTAGSTASVAIFSGTASSYHFSGTASSLTV